MKILWKTNIMLPIIAKDLGVEESVIGGWFVGLAKGLMKVQDIELAICFPNGTKGYIKGEVQNLKYYGFPQKTVDSSKYDSSVEPYFTKIINDFKPDIVHIFGTELPHTLSLVKVFNRPDQTMINIQGLTSICASLYSVGLPQYVRFFYSFRDIIRRDNIRNQEKVFYKRGQFERSAIQKVTHIVGRTEWDQATSYQINNQRVYHHCNETLRDSFYQSSWNIEKIERHSLLMSQAHYPIKGLHFFLSIFSNLIRKYPDAKLYIAGHDIFRGYDLKSQLKQPYYAKYLKKIIKKNNMQDHVIFLGNLSEEEMVKRFLKTHVFISPSIIENESNSLSEAKILGCPSVASYVGGVTNRILHGVDGFLYPLQETYMMEYYIDQIFSHDDLAIQISTQARINAHQLHDREKNLNQMISIYKSILKD